MEFISSVFKNKISIVEYIDRFITRENIQCTKILNFKEKLSRSQRSCINCYNNLGYYCSLYIVFANKTISYTFNRSSFSNLKLMYSSLLFNRQLFTNLINSIKNNKLIFDNDGEIVIDYFNIDHICNLIDNMANTINQLNIVKTTFCRSIDINITERKIIELSKSIV